MRIGVQVHVYIYIYIYETTCYALLSIAIVSKRAVPRLLAMSMSMCLL